MASSGVPVAQECLDEYQDLKLGKKYKWIIFKLNDKKTEIVVDKRASESNYDDFVKALPAEECRWAVYDFDYVKEDGGKRNKICFYSWSPDDAKIKDKMVSAASREALRKALVGIAAEIQGSDYSEVAYESVFDKVSRGN